MSVTRHLCLTGGDVTALGELDGVSQWGSLTGTSPPPRTEVLVQVNEAAAIIQGTFKLVKGESKRTKIVRQALLIFIFKALSHELFQNSPNSDILLFLKKIENN